MSNFLNDVPGLKDLRVDAGAAAPRRSRLRFITNGDITLTDNPVTEETELDLTALGTPGTPNIVVGAGLSGDGTEGDPLTVTGAVPSAPSGSAGGDLGGTYPNPTVTQARGLRETAGPTTLAMGAVGDLKLLTRSGTALVGRVPGDFTHQASPTPAMKLPLDDAGAIKYCTIAELLTLVGGVSGSTGNPFTDPPGSQNAFDDEFLPGSSPDLATRGYTVKTNSGTTLTRGGDIAPWDTTGPTGNTYWSSIVGSWLFFQPPANTQVFIFKAIALALGDTYFTRTAAAYRFDSGAAGRFQEIGLYGNSGGNIDVGNRVYNSVYETNGAPMQMDMGRNTGGGAFVGISRNMWHPSDIRGVFYHTSNNNYNIFAVNGANGQSVTYSSTGGPAASNIAYFGICITPGASAATPTLLSIDFIRKKSSNAWIIP